MDKGSIDFFEILGFLTPIYIKIDFDNSVQESNECRVIFKAAAVGYLVLLPVE